MYCTYTRPWKSREDSFLPNGGWGPTSPEEKHTKPEEAKASRDPPRDGMLSRGAVTSANYSCFLCGFFVF